MYGKDQQKKCCSNFKRVHTLPGDLVKVKSFFLGLGWGLICISKKISYQIPHHTFSSKDLNCLLILIHLILISSLKGLHYYYIRLVDEQNMFQ